MENNIFNNGKAGKGLVRIYVYYISVNNKIEKKKLLIDLNEINNFDGKKSLISILTKEFRPKIRVSLEENDIEIFYNYSWHLVCDFNSFNFYVARILATSPEKLIKLRLKMKKLKKKKFAEEDTINMNKINMPEIKCDEIKCVFCKNYCNNRHYRYRLGPMYGPFRVNNKDYFSHIICLLWCPKVYINDTKKKFVGVEEEIKRSLKEVCFFCGEYGGTINCVGKKCSKNAHFLCAKKDGWQLDPRTFRAYCPIHSETQFGSDSDQDQNKGDSIEEPFKINQLIFPENFLEIEKEKAEKEKREKEKMEKEKDEREMNEKEKSESHPIILTKKRVTEVKIIYHDDSFCGVCHNSFSESKIKCRRCRNVFHPKCIGLNKNYNLTTGYSKISEEVEDINKDIIHFEYICNKCKDKEKSHLPGPKFKVI